MDRQQQAAARQLLTHAKTLGLQLPKPVREAHAKVEKIRAGMGSIPAHNLAGVATAVAAALGRDADPTTDPEVAQAIALNAITMPSVIDHIEAASFSGLWEACRDHQDDIVAELRKPFDKAAAALVVAHERIGDFDLKTDSNDILKQGGDIAAVWAQAVEADKLIASVVASWFELGQFLHPGLADRRWVNLRLVNPPADVWDEHDLSRTLLGPWDAVRAGLALTLPTLAGFDERRANLTARRAEIAAAAAELPKRMSYL